MKIVDHANKPQQVPTKYQTKGHYQQSPDKSGSHYQQPQSYHSRGKDQQYNFNLDL